MREQKFPTQPGSWVIYERSNLLTLATGMYERQGPLIKETACN